LVAEAFLPRPPSRLADVGHLDGDPTNCRASNLRWRFSRASLTPAEVMEIARAAGGVLTPAEVAAGFGVARSTVRDIWSGTSWRCVVGLRFSTPPGFGPRLRRLRLARGLTLVELGARANVHANTITRWERGIERPSERLLIRVAQALGTSAERLLSP
jgi:transcriptional regulator with XRE-family HTH domain